MFWIILSVLLWGLLHSLLASSRSKEIAQRVFGAGVKRFYRLAYNVFACISFLPVLVVLFIVPDRTLYIVIFPWAALMLGGEALAVAALVVGLLLSRPLDFAGLRQLGTPDDRPAQLITDGLYRYVRHPLYTAGLVFIWLLPVMTANVLAVNIALTVYVIIGAFLEEHRLQSEFGQVYRDYMASTPMFIPFPKRNKTR
jgi:protein-S-isoprenylcysteine O-methyltransferase Ste14